jgi:hypothetical protein
MDEIRKQVSKAHRRLTLQQFLAIVPWTMFAALAAAIVALAVPRVWAIEALAGSPGSLYWTWGWIGGCLLLGLAAAIVWTRLARRGELQAAIEIDRRFGLKERVSSALSLGPRDVDSEFGRALVQDATRRVGGIDVREHFKLGVSWRVLLPLAPAAAAFALALLVPCAVREKTTQATESPAAIRQQTKSSIEALKKRLSESKKIAEEKGLKDAEAHLQELMQRLEKLDSEADKLDRKEALVKLNDLKEDLEQRRKQLGGAEDMRKQMNQLKDVQRGPADRAAKAMKDGDFKQAMNELQQLQDKLQAGEMNAEEQKALAQQLEQMQQKLNDLADAHEQAKQELEQQIQQKKNEGDLEAAGKLQQKLDELKQLDQQMNNMKQMADKLGECSKCLGENGNPQQAAEKLGQIAEQLGQMQQQLDELETLDEAMQQIADAKNAMACKECNGQGCAHCQGQGQKNDQPGNGMGEGRGGGARPEEETPTGEFQSRVRGNVQPGESVRTGDADGPNAKGVTKESVKEEIKAAMSRDVDPLTNQRIPREQRDHAREYFERYREGK